jgi:hypothetical protein
MTLVVVVVAVFDLRCLLVGSLVGVPEMVVTHSS